MNHGTRSFLTASVAICFFLAVLTSAQAQNATPISDVGDDYLGNYQTNEPRVAYNSTNNEFLVVWWGDDTVGDMVEGEEEVLGQRIDATTGEEIGENDFRISFAGTNGVAQYDALNPDIVYNSTENEYFVVWSASSDKFAAGPDEFEIMGQRINAETGDPQGTVIRVSNMGPDGDGNYDAEYPAVAFDPARNRYLVVWQGDTDDFGMIDDEVEIFGQYIDGSDGSAIGPDFRISTVGPLGAGLDAVFYEALLPAVAYNSALDKYLVTFFSDDNSHVSASNEEYEIFGHFVHPTAGEEGSDFLISDMGIWWLNLGMIGRPAMAANPDRSEFLVAWSAFHDIAGLSGDGSRRGHEIFAQIVDSSGPVLADEVRVSDVGGEGWDSFYAESPAAIYNSAGSEFLVAFRADDNVNGATNEDEEIFLQRLDAETLTEIGPNDKRFSYMGQELDTSFNAESPALALNPNTLEALLVWNGWDNYVQGYYEVYADFVDLNPQGSLLTSFCSEWNGFLDMWNIGEFGNTSASGRTIESTLMSIDGTAQSVSSFGVLSGAQTDLLVHDMVGFTANSYGKVCSTHDGSTGEIYGRTTFYRPNATGYDFAFAVPFENGLRGTQYVPFNTYQPSLDAADAGNLAANWVQLSNNEENEQSGTLTFYDVDGNELGAEARELAAGERQDVSAHQYGSNIVGLVKWQPDNALAHTLLRNVRYYYDNNGTSNSFDSAFQLGGRNGTSNTVYVPVDTREGTSVLEIVNTSDVELDLSITVYSDSGSEEVTQNWTRDPYSSLHIVLDSLLTSSLGLAKIEVTNAGRAMVTAMQYGRDTSLGINYVYGIQSIEPVGSTLRGSYNTFLEQGCSLIIANTDSSDQTVTLSMTRYDGTNVISAQSETVPANGAVDLDICAGEQANAYGVVRVVGTVDDSLLAVVVRKGANDDYRFPTSVR